MSSTADWKALAHRKRQQIHEAIPRSWLLPSIPTPEEQPDVTGGYIDKFLTQKEKEITETDAEQIVARIANGAWAAVDVTKAFCHRAAIASQLVRRHVSIIAHHQALPSTERLCSMRMF